MINIREQIDKKPWLGWLVAGVLLVIAVFIYVRRSSNADPYSPERMTDMVTIKFTDTGDEIEMPRGRLDKELRGRPDFDPSKGVINPKTGAATGFPFDKKEWETWLGRIKQEKDEAKAAAPANSPERGKVVRPSAPAVLPPTTEPAPAPK